MIEYSGSRAPHGVLLLFLDSEAFILTDYYKKLIDLKRQGLRVSEIADITGQPVRTVSRHLKELGLTKNGRPDISNVDVLDMWNDGCMVSGIAEHFNTSYETVFKRLRCMGITSSRSDGSGRCDLSDRCARFVQKAEQAHGGVYDYGGVVYRNSKTKVCIFCSKHGAFEQTPDKHLRGQGCPLCGRDKLQAMRLEKRMMRVSRLLGVMCACLREIFGDDDVIESSESVCGFYVKSRCLHVGFDASGVDYTGADGLNCIIFRKFDLSDFFDWVADGCPGGML